MSRASRNPELSKRLAELRAALDLDKGKLAKALDVSRAAMQHWESGRSRPSAETYVDLIRLSVRQCPSAAAWFLKQTGIGLKELRALVPEIERSLAQRERPARSGEIFNIPHTRRVPSSGEPDLSVPGSMIRNRTAATYLRLSSDAMGPMFRLGDAIVLDESEADPWTLAGKWVALYRAFRIFAPSERAEVLASREAPDKQTIADPGVIIGLLSAELNGAALVLETIRGSGQGVRREIIAAGRRSAVDREGRTAGEFRLLGRVIAWISSE